MNTQRNHTLELLKLFASYMVVFIHVLFYGKMGIVVDALARFAVPFFFLVSGYYSYKISLEKIKKRIKKLLVLLISSAVCYTVFEIVKLLKYNPDELAVFLNKYTDISTYINLLVFNVSISSGHLWYFLAIIYVCIIFYFVTKFGIKEKVIFITSLLLLLLHVVLGECLSVFGIVTPIPYIRNFLLMGVPFFALGLIVNKHQDKLEKLPNYMIFVFALIGIFETVTSRLLFGANELYIGSLFILAAIVCVFIKCANVKYPAFLTALEGCSTYIFIFHIIISTVILIICGIIGIDIYSSVTLQNLYPIAVCVASTVFSYILIRILKKVGKGKA